MREKADILIKGDGKELEMKTFKFQFHEQWQQVSVLSMLCRRQHHPTRQVFGWILLPLMKKPIRIWPPTPYEYETGKVGNHRGEILGACLCNLQLYDASFSYQAVVSEKDVLSKRTTTRGEVADKGSVSDISRFVSSFRNVFYHVRDHVHARDHVPFEGHGEVRTSRKIFDTVLSKSSLEWNLTLRWTEMCISGVVMLPLTPRHRLSRSSSTH